MAEKLLITREQLLKYTSIGGETDMDKIVPSMIVAEEIEVQQQLGTNLYDKMKTLVNDGTINDPGNENYLYILNTFIVQIMAHYTASSFYLFHSYQVNNTGVIRPTSSNGLLPEPEEVNLLSQREADRGAWYIKRFVDYMCSFGSLFPEWSTNTNDELSPAYGKNRPSWYLG